MRSNGLLRKFTLLMLLLLPLCAVDEARREKILCEVISQGLESWHYRPQPFNDQFSRQSLALYLKNLDSNKSFLLESDLKELQGGDFLIAKEIVSGSLDLARLGSRLLRERILQVQAFCRDILAQPFDFTEKETIELDGDKRSYARTPEELRGWWKRQLKYLALIRTANAETAKAREGAEGKKDAAASPAPQEEKIRKEVAGSMERFFRRLLQERPEETRARLLNSAIAAFDPHSRYFPPRDKEDFDIEMSGTLEGVGILLTEEDGMIKVLDVVPGSPAWIQNQIKVEDKVLKVAQSDDEPVDVMGMPVSDVARLVRGRKGTVVRLTVRKPDGRIMEIKLIRNVIEIQETYARPAILVGEQVPTRIGYIYLPKFYRDFNREDGRSSADDVRRELEALKKQNVAGIILDLRGNSGGALDDSVRMAGLFIDKGPVVQMKDRRDSPQVYRDENPAVAYSGPLIVLVNALSASASEILAACLQDYGRAVIVGGSQTFGKGTVQMMVDLDRVLTGDLVDLRPLGAITLTVQKYYRISGASTQFKGIVPDIILPEPASYLEIGERYLDNALPWDATSPVSFNRWKHPVANLPELAARSRERVQKSERFGKLVQYYESLKERRDRSRVTLNLDEYRREQEMLWKRADDLAKWEKLPLNFKVFDAGGKPPVVDAGKLPSDQAKLNSWLKELGHDEIVDEAIRIIQDWIAGERK